MTHKHTSPRDLINAQLVGFRIRWLYPIHRSKTSPLPKKGVLYDIKLHQMITLHFWRHSGECLTPSLPLLPGPLWLGVVVLLGLIYSSNRSVEKLFVFDENVYKNKLLRNNYTKNIWTYKECNFQTFTDEITWRVDIPLKSTDKSINLRLKYKYLNSLTRSYQSMNNLSKTCPCPPISDWTLTKLSYWCE